MNLKNMLGELKINWRGRLISILLGLKPVAIFITFYILLEVILRKQSALPPTMDISGALAILFLLGVLFQYSALTGKVILIVFCAFGVLFQSAHAIFYGSWIDPMNLYLFFLDFGEVAKILPELSLGLILTTGILFLLTVIFTGLFLRMARNSKQKIWVTGLVILFFLIQPVRDGLFYPDKIETRLTKESHSMFRSLHNSLGVVFSMLIRQAIGKQKYPDYHHVPYPKKEEGIEGDSRVNIFVYFGESLSSKYMSIFGYDKPTTPYLRSIDRQYPYNLKIEAIAGSTMTRVSTQMFFNLVPYPDGRKQIATMRTNLFRYASEQKYEVGYFSTQAENTINHIVLQIGKNFIDAKSSPARFSPAEFGVGDNADDYMLLQMFDEYKLEEPFFVVFQPNGSHPPFHERSPNGLKKFGTDTDKHEYENSVHYTDFVIKSLVEKIDSVSTLPWVLIITSDHGSYVDDLRTTRSTEFEASYMVPFVAVTNSEDVYERYLSPHQECDVVPHQRIAQTLSNILGYDTPYSPCDQGIITSGLLSGVGGTQKVIWKEGIMMREPYEAEVQ